ncbi:MAG: HD-GYP domain-containing protein [Dehalococcoidales bacterium]|nr:HD-GYP domain-containing protein [Dehalococcoidales bacterium]
MIQERLEENCQSLFSLHKRLDGLINEIRSSLDDAIQAITGLIEVVDPYTTGHQKRVACLGKEIAGELGLTDDSTELIQQAAYVHDIGKVYIPAEILNRPGKLTEAEYERIKLHPQIGYTILNRSRYFPGVDTVVLQHHERINGSGYPNGLRGEAISLEARIISVADVIDAMAVARPYRPALGVSAALSEIADNSSVLYDENVVRACLRFFGKKGFKPAKSQLRAG